MNLRNVKNYILLLAIIIFFLGCSKDKFEATVPAYISIDDILFSTDYATEGSASSNITDAWVYIDDNLVGVYELPATFPVLKEGNVEVKIYAGIKDNGITASRARYLLYDPHIQTINLVPEETIKIIPTVGYNPDVKFTWLEDFETASLSFLYHTRSDTIIMKQNNDVKEGNFSGHVYLESNMDFFEATSIEYGNVPKNGSPVYLEIDFKTNEPVLIGVYHNGIQGGSSYLAKTDGEWKKIYVNLTSLSGAVQSSTALKVFLGMQEFPNAPFTVTNPEVFIDNIKLVHY